VFEWPLRGPVEDDEPSERPFSDDCTEHGNLMGIWDKLHDIFDELVLRGFAGWIDGDQASTDRTTFCGDLAGLAMDKLKYRKGLQSSALERVMLERLADSLRVALGVAVGVPLGVPLGVL
jgi:hypothetical protein